eukprot:gene5136-6553_t
MGVRAQQSALGPASDNVSGGCPNLHVWVVGSIKNVSCANGQDGSASVAATGGKGPYTYVWMPGNLTGDTQKKLPAAVYTVTATDSNQCSGSISVVVNEPQELKLKTAHTFAACGKSDGTATALVE